MLKHTDDYSQVVDDYMVRQFLKPGITGWADQRIPGEITNPEQIRMRVNKDLWYWKTGASGLISRSCSLPYTMFAGKPECLLTTELQYKQISCKKEQQLFPFFISVTVLVYWFHPA